MPSGRYDCYMTIDRIWYILGKKLSNDATKEELAELDELLRVHPELCYPVQHIIDLWNLDRPEDTMEARQALQQHLLRLQGGDASADNPRIPSNRWKYKMVAAAVFLVVASLSLYFITGNTGAPQQWVDQAPAKSRNEVSTQPGSHSKVVLPDGSRVWLNAQSRLEYDKNFDQGIREVVLEGEAYFDVEKDPARPFIIHTNNADIKVLGTTFNLKSYKKDGYTEASLIEGQIEVSVHDRPDEKILMKPAEKLVIRDRDVMPPAVAKAATASPAPLIIERTSISYQPADSTVEETLWMENRLIFRNRSFESITSDLERRYGFAFHFENEAARDLRFDANFKNETILQVLEALKMANHFNYQINKDVISIK